MMIVAPDLLHVGKKKKKKQKAKIWFSSSMFQFQTCVYSNMPLSTSVRVTDDPLTVAVKRRTIKEHDMMEVH